MSAPRASAKLVGAQAVTVQAAELPQALATGVVNSFMSSGATGYDCKVWESLTHFYDTQAWIPKNVTHDEQGSVRCASTSRHRSAVLKAAAAAEERGWKVWQDKSGWYPDQLGSHGMKVLPPGPTLASRTSRKSANSLTADWLKKAGAEGEAVIATYKKN